MVIYATLSRNRSGIVEALGWICALGNLVNTYYKHMALGMTWSIGQLLVQAAQQLVKRYPHVD